MVAGHITEYSAIPFVLFFLAEYAALLLIRTLSRLFFFGAGYIGIKTCAIVFLYVWVRGTLPRLRYTDLINFGWGSLLPLAFGLFAGVVSLGA